MNAVTTTASNALTPTSMESAIKLAEMMARGKLVPSHLHNSPGDCLMVIEASMRWQMSPFAVAQSTSVIQGKLMFEGKLVAAALNASGILSSRLDYDFSGEGAQRAVKVSGTIKGETKAREVTVFLADAKTSNGMWTKQPDQQLVYAGTRVWARRHAPEVMLGVYAPEEFDQAAPFDGPTLEAEPEQPDARDAINEEVPNQRAAAANMQRAPRVTDKPKPTQGPTKQRGYREIMDSLSVAFRDAQTHEEADRILCSDDVAYGRATFRGEGLAELERMITAAQAKWWPEEPEDELPEIVGEEKLSAG